MVPPWLRSVQSSRDTLLYVLPFFLAMTETSKCLIWKTSYSTIQHKTAECNSYTLMSSSHRIISSSQLYLYSCCAVVFAQFSGNYGALCQCPGGRAQLRDRRRNFLWLVVVNASGFSSGYRFTGSRSARNSTWFLKHVHAIFFFLEGETSRVSRTANRAPPVQCFCRHT